MIRILMIFVVSCAMLGCAPSHSFQIDVNNQLEQPVTVWLTKSGPPYESKWLPPEELAMRRPSLDDPIAGVVVPPGKSANTEIRGRFPGDTVAILRVYLGQRTMSELLSISRGSPNRIEVVLQPGQNDLVVRQHAGRVVVEPRGANPATTMSE